MTESRRPLKTREASWAKAFANWLARQHVTPNAISLAGVVMALLGAGLLVIAQHDGSVRWLLLFAGATAVQLRLLCNMLDGMVAVEGGFHAPSGIFFNEAPDRAEDVMLLVAAGFAADVPWLGWMAATCAVLTAYVRALGASLGKGQDFAGPLAKPQRMFVLTLGCLGEIGHAGILRWALWIIACGAFLTTARRLLRLYRRVC